MRTAILASGSGTILESVLEAGIDIHLVLVDRPCRAEEIAGEHGVPVERVLRSNYGSPFDRDAFTRSVEEVLRDHRIDLVAMAGFMTVLGKSIFDSFNGRIINTHPSILPAFPGAHAVRDAVAARAKVTGCTMHVATAEVDHGPILYQGRVRVRRDDTEATLHERIKRMERHRYPVLLEVLAVELEQSRTLRPVSVRRKLRAALMKERHGSVPELRPVTTAAAIFGAFFLSGLMRLGYNDSAVRELADTVVTGSTRPVAAA